MSGPAPSLPAELDISSALASKVAQVSKVHFNVDQEAIVITEDKMRLCLMTHLKDMEARRGWIAPAGILSTIVVALVSTNFKDVGLDASTWKALFIVAGILCLGWFIVCVRNARSAPSIEDVVSRMKAAGEEEGGA